MNFLVATALTSTLCIGCMTPDDPVVEVSQSATGYVAAVVAATDTFTATVAATVHDDAAAVGLALPASVVATGYSPRNTLGAGAASGAQLVFVARAFIAGRSTYPPGLYQLTPTSHVYYDGSAGRIDLGLGTPDHTAHSDDQGLCDMAPSLIHDLCLDFVACALYDEGCPGLPPSVVG